MDNRSLRRMRDDVEQLHHLHRRQFLKRAGIGGAVVAVGASASLAGVLSQASAQTTAAAPTLDDNDLGWVQFLQTIELAVSELYDEAIGTRHLDSVTAETARAFRQHHTDYAAALATLAAKSSIDRPNSTLVTSVSPSITSASTPDDVLASLFQLERSAAATYELALGAVGSTAVSAVLSTIQPVEGQMEAAWGTVLELPIDQWLPAFVSDAEAYQPSQYVA